MFRQISDVEHPLLDLEKFGMMVIESIKITFHLTQQLVLIVHDVNYSSALIDINDMGNSIPVQSLPDSYCLFNQHRVMLGL